MEVSIALLKSVSVYQISLSVCTRKDYPAIVECTIQEKKQRFTLWNPVLIYLFHAYNVHEHS